MLDATADVRHAAALAKARTQPVSHDYQGYFDYIVQGQAIGWACDRLDMERRLRVEIWEDDIFLASGEASRFRADLQAAGIGDGQHLFQIPLPAELANGREHLLHARISGSDARLVNTHAYFAVSDVSATINEADGLSLRGTASSLTQQWRTADVSADGEIVGTIAIAPSANNAPFAVELPPALADGQVHWFQAKLRDSGTVIGEAVFPLAAVATPEVALQTYASEFPGHLSHAAAQRYASLSAQLADAAAYLARQEAGGTPLTLDDHYRQLHAAHRQVKAGIREQHRMPDCIRFPVFATPDVSIVIPAHNKFWTTYTCLSALLLAATRVTYEVIVVDDGSSDQTARLHEVVDGITICRNDVNAGFVKSSNIGAKAARGKYVVMLNNDTEPSAYWLDELVHVFENFENVGLAGGKLVYPSGKLQEAGGIVFHDLNAWNYGRHGNPADPRYNYTRQVDYVSGACIMLERRVWDELGGFDEHFAPAYYEDTDLAFRVRAKGLSTYYTPFATIIHHEGVSNGTAEGAGVKRYQTVNEPKFRSRWASTIRSGSTILDQHLAKDRGVSLRALVIDAQAPQPDKDAGSFAAIQEMRLLQALGLKLSFVPMNLAYLGNYTEALQRMGVECLYAPFVPSVERLIEERGQEFDVFYITRYAVADRYIDLIRRLCPRAKIVFNNADLHFLREIRAALAAKNPGALESATRTREAELAVMKRTDVTLSYTDTEAAVIASHNLDGTRVARCPWVVEPQPQGPPFAARDGLAFLGNYQHPPNEEAVRYFVTEIMPELRQRVPGITLHIYGSHLPDRIRALAAADIAIEGYVPDVAQVYHGCRIFVAPLLSGAGIKGKVLGALAYGTPTIMTALASEGIGLGRGADAIVADGVAEWVAAVAALYNDEARWTEMSRRAQDFVRENFSFEKGLVAMRAALAQAYVFVG